MLVGDGSWVGVFVGGGVAVGNGVFVGCGVFVGGGNVGDGPAVGVLVGGTAVAVLACAMATACFAATGVTADDCVAFGLAKRDRMMARRTRPVIPPSVYKMIFQSFIRQPFMGVS